MNFYLHDNRSAELADIKRLSSERSTPESEAQILKYVREALSEFVFSFNIAVHSDDCNRARSSSTPIHDRVCSTEYTNLLQVSEVFRTARNDTDLSQSTKVQNGQQVVADVRAANLDVR